MATHEEKAHALAAKITSRAEDALAGLEREMTIMKWPGEFRSIVWGAVAQLATRRAIDARLSDDRQEEAGRG